MDWTIGVLAGEEIAVGLVQNHQLASSIHLSSGLHGLPADDVAGVIRSQALAACAEKSVPLEDVKAIGIGFPGIIRDGFVEESPNVQQVKGLNLEAAVRNTGFAHVLVLNDAEATAAGIAATRGQLEHLIRVWTLGEGIGFGRYPQAQGVWEGGHSVVSLDPKEQYCGCGGQGHLEGIMGHRAMRKRFLDLEPEEVFANARTGDARCCAFVKLWHRALAAATATTVHQDGPGRFFISGPNSRFIDLPLISQYLHDMVKMSPLQGSVFEVISTSDETGIIGAAVNAAKTAASA